MSTIPPITLGDERGGGSWWEQQIIKRRAKNSKGKMEGHSKRGSGPIDKGGEASVDPTDAVLEEIKQQYAQMIAAMPAPDFADYVDSAAFDEAEQQARTTYRESRPVINDVMAALDKDLKKSAKETRREGKRANQEVASDAREGQRDAKQIAAMVAADLQGQAGEGGPVQSLMDEQAFQAAAIAQAERAKARDARALAQDLTRNEVESTRDRRATGKAVRASAHADARNNLDAILNQLNMERTAAESQGRMAYNQARDQYAQQIAGLRFDSAQAQMDHRMGQEQAGMEQLLRYEEMQQAANAAAMQEASSVADAAMQMGGGDMEATIAAANRLVQQHSTGWANGMTQSGLPVDPMAVRAQLQALIRSMGGTRN